MATCPPWCRPRADPGNGDGVIAEVVRAAWSQSPAQVVAAVLLTPVAVVVGWAVLVVVLVMGGAR